MVFHEGTSRIYDWLRKQPNVKEESLTDWLLYYISECCPNIYYQEFTRRKEANNGADWEWWILTSHYDREYKAYRFLVQAKKLITNDKDNYSLLSYENQNGYQIELLLQSAECKNAFPLYMYYSASSVDINKQKNEFSCLDSSIISWCEDCENGCYLSPAAKVYDELYKLPGHRLKDSDLLNKALKLSLLDMLFSQDVESVLSRFNREYVLSDKNNIKGNNYQGVIGIQHSGKGIPQYLKMFVERGGKNMDWLQTEMRINDLDGIGVLDFRNIDKNKDGHS